MHYARMVDVDLFVSPPLAEKLQQAAARIEALYAQRAGDDVIARLAKGAAANG